METKKKLTIAAVAIKKLSAKILKKSKGVNLEASLDVLDDALSVLDEASAIMEDVEEAKVAREYVDVAWVKARDVCADILDQCLGGVQRDMMEITYLLDDAIENLEYEAGVKIPPAKKEIEE